MAISIADALRSSNNWILDAVRFAAVWVAYSDHEIQEVEHAALEAMVPDRPGGVPLSVIIDAIQRASASQDYRVTAQVFKSIREGLSDKSKTAFLQLIIDIIRADGRVSQGERHAVLFLADLIGRSSEAHKLFLEATGLRLDELADLSDPGYWENLDASRRQQHNQEQADAQDSKRERRQGKHASPGDPRRVEALAILGLVGEPSTDDIRAAYRRLTQIHHPDRYTSLGAEALEHATRNFQRIQAAYSVLKAPA